MITTEITAQDHAGWKEYTRLELIDVATLDGQDITDGFALVVWDFIDRSGYSVYYQQNGKYYKTFAQLRKPTGKLVAGYSDVDFSLVYDAERPGKYPDTAETYQRFVAAKKSYKPKKDIKNLPVFIQQRLQDKYPIRFVHCYPGNLFILDDGQDHGDRFCFMNPHFLEEDFLTGDIDEAQTGLFQIFMLYGSSF